MDMSFLEIPGMHGILDDAVSMFVPWREEQKDRTERSKAATKADKLEAAEKEARRKREEDYARAQQDLEFQAVQELRGKVVSALERIEVEAAGTTSLVIEIRGLSQSPLLNARDLQGLDASLVEMESAVISIQAGTVVNTGTFDTEELARGYADAQSGFVAMRSVRARATGVMQALEQEIRNRAAEKVRQQTSAAAEVRAQSQLAAQQQAESEWRQAEAGRQGRRDLMGRVMQVDLELSNQRRRLAELKVELANLRFYESQRRR